MRVLRAFALFLSLLVASAAQAGGWNPLLPAPARSVGVGIGSSTLAPVVLLSAPFTTVGGAFAADTNTVSNVSWNGASIVDPYNTWTQNGTVPQVTASPWYPRGFAINRAGAGPFSATNFYTLPSPNSVQFPGAWSVCAISSISALTNFEMGVSQSSSGPTGWDLYADSTGKVVLGTAGLVKAFDAGAAVVGTNIVCFGWDGATWRLKVNLRPMVSATASYTPAPTTPAWIGGRGGLTVLSPNTRFFEVWYSNGTAPTDALFTQIQTAFYSNPSNPIADDSNTIAHVIWNGTALVDTFGNPWTMNGTVPQVPSSTGFPAPPMFGAGPYSVSNYYSLGTGSDVLDFTGDFSACFVQLGGATGSAFIFYNRNVGAGTDGYLAGLENGCYVATEPGGTVASTANAAIYSAGNICCVGRAGTTLYAKGNLLALSTTAGSTITPGTTRIATLGANPNQGIPYDRSIHAVWFSTTTPSDSLFTSIQSRLFGHVAATGQTFTVSRATTATAEPREAAVPSLYTYPANILRITETGALLEATTTNLVLQSEALDNIAWTTTGTCAVTANSALFANGLQAMELVKCSGAVTDTRNQAITVPSSTGPWTASVWMTGPAATPESLTMTVGAGLTTGCTCASSEPGVSCTVGGVGTATAFAYATPGVGPSVDRISLTCSSTLATTTVTIGVHDGQYGTTFNVGGNFGGAQLEIAGYASSYIPTTTATVARNADVVTVANPLPVGPFCVTGTWTPALAPLSTWASAVRDLWVFGAPFVANSARVQVPTNGSIIFQVIDGASANKTWTVAAGALTGSAAHTVTACSDNTGTGTVTLDGVSQSVTVAGAGTGVLSTMGTISLSTTASSLPPVAIQNFKVCKGSDPSRCQ